MIRVGVLTISDREARGEVEDLAYAAIREALSLGPYEITHYEIVPDEPAQIKRVLRLWTDREGLDVILTSGSIRLSRRDHAPEATREMLEKEAPGIAELIRREAYKKSPLAALSRGVAGVRGKTLIVNLPGGPQACRDSLEVLLPLLPEAVERITGRPVGQLAQSFWFE
ncbi:MAG: MogA/MoaB family molybdenum cofactor biosynthesis protein [Meiothermus sp.]|uniref:MogA/MoaB family molybdenum cofactor biosynthesis protein n=1 Tax=Meiothermus sp. TaxID=1955249 RepID=UPI0025EC0DDE|nr:MogA/MoaB family molybdenum cofactor biosynthesis protein [Meiothermus sp.]MCS7059277.1 MogA/MoaB family molybdenum cofactor biosynthesis protein [Meiothermus sp.]MCS7195180.1 MogA/MoaB family molybdenum cofactor biosynthesis protein [Meiothermus sp.]MCX7740363.1 MogA/MoaB family molybdenum cofactor biosynthesis protein [Meiothermus sp.]MDW8091693.1 MogA/MoaB family molybdenum cofactor biosynthesis protein [Meiothermus sp.]MDW8482097.1 MogA/MoaB family molybdenum cofactor biosynthesis prote